MTAESANPSTAPTTAAPAPGPAVAGAPPPRISTLLFDLDGTLVAMRQGRVELAFTMRAIWRFRGIIAPWRLRPMIRHAVAAMRSHGSTRTNFEVFVDALARLSGRPPSEVEARVRALSDRDFGRLASRFYPIPGARETVIRARELGFRTVLATDPVFPLTAVRLRMEWGSVADIPWDLVASSEIMTRCKPDPDYFREVAERAGVRPDECLMVGNDARMDLPAREAGLLTYLVDHPWSQGAEEAAARGLEPHISGTFADLCRWLESVKPPSAPLTSS